MKTLYKVTLLFELDDSKPIPEDWNWTRLAQKAGVEREAWAVVQESQAIDSTDGRELAERVIATVEFSDPGAMVLLPGCDHDHDNDDWCDDPEVVLDVDLADFPERFI